MRRAPEADERRAVTLRRRPLLAGAALVASLAGCSGRGDGGSGTDQPFAALDRATVFVDDGVELSVPAELSTADEPAEAGLVVVPGDTDRSPTQSVEWIADGRSVALLGAGCGETWNSWVSTSAYATSFDVMGAEWGSPGADLVVGTAVGLNLVTYGRRLAGTPTDRDILHELDAIVADIAARTGGD